MTFALGSRSISRLDGALPQVCALTMLAIRHTTVDFSVITTVRTAEEQRALPSVVTRHSDPETAAHVQRRAVDVVTYGVDDVWAPAHYYPIALAFSRAAQALGLEGRWGGMWGVYLSRLCEEYPNADYLRVARDRYVELFRRRNGRPPLADLVHFEVTI